MDCVAKTIAKAVFMFERMWTCSLCADVFTKPSLKYTKIGYFEEIFRMWERSKTTHCPPQTNRCGVKYIKPKLLKNTI